MHNIPDFLRVTPEMQEHFAKGGMIKRADGSYSRRGLWDNIRANKGSGKKPTKEMLEQERKIRAKEYEVGGPITFSAGGEKHRVYEKESPTGNGKGVQGHIMVTHPTTDKGQWDTIDLTEKAGAHTVAEGVAATKEWHAEHPEYGNGGYTVKRSNARKGKTHVVIGPDGTKKYFGDSKLGQHPNDPARKKAFYARHKHNLAHNPYFRAFARATWADGGEVPESDIFNNWKKQNNFNPGQWWQDQTMKDPSRNVSTGPEIGPVLSNYDDPFHSWNIPSRGSVESMTPPTFSDGGSYGPFYNRRDAAKLQRWRNPTADSMTPHFDLGGLNELQTATGNSGQGINTTSPAWSPSISPVATTPNITTAGLDKQNQNQFTMDEKQMTVNQTGPSDNTKMQPGVDVTDSLKPSSGSIMDTLNKLSGYSALGKGIEQLQNAGEQALGATNILSRGFANSQQNAILDFNRKQDNPTNYLNKVSNFAGIQYSKNGGTIGQYKEGDELELTPTQMYLLEKKGYKFQILNK